MSEGRSYFEAAGYEVQSLLGKGSDARVWLVRDRQFGHLRALKVLNDTVGEDLVSSDSFFRECALLLRICNGGHPNIVRIGRPRVVENKAMVEMQYIQGRTLTDYIHNDLHFVPYDEVLRFVRDIGSALAYCHAEAYKWMMAPGEDKEMTPEELSARYGVAHNDLHSSNVMRNSVNDSYILLDFGLAIQDGVAVRSSMRNEGHPEYRAPEKFEAKMGGKQGDIRVDVYAFGILLYEMLAGETPFQAKPGDLETGRIYRLHKEAPVPEIEPKRRAKFLGVNPGATFVKDYPGWLENMVRKCLAKDPDARYANLKEFMDEFEANIAREKRIASRRLDSLSREKGELVKENSELQASIRELEKQIETLKNAGKQTVAPAPTASPRIRKPKERTASGHTPAWQGVLLGFVPMAAIGRVSSTSNIGDAFSELIKDNGDDSEVDFEDRFFLDSASLGPLPVASTVSEAGSFAQAFSSARRELGPGGVFRWNGNVYTTYTAEEWARLTPEQQAAFTSGVQEAEAEAGTGLDQQETIVAEADMDLESRIDDPDVILDAGDSDDEIQDAPEDVLAASTDEVHVGDGAFEVDGLEAGSGFDGDQPDDAGAVGDYQ